MVRRRRLGQVGNALFLAQGRHGRDVLRLGVRSVALAVQDGVADVLGGGRDDAFAVVAAGLVQILRASRFGHVQLAAVDVLHGGTLGHLVSAGGRCEVVGGGSVAAVVGGVGAHGSHDLRGALGLEPCVIG